MKNGIEYLLNNACPSIKYRVHKEILNESTESSEMTCLQEQILQDEIVRTIIGRQQTNGWIGREFRGEEAVLDINSFDDVSEKYKDKLVFKPGVRFPCIYDLRLLAYTHTWRMEGNLSMIANSINRLVELSPISYIHVKEKAQMIAPASVFMGNFRMQLKN